MLSDSLNYLQVLWTDYELEMIKQSATYKETIKQRNHFEKEYLAIKPVSIVLVIC